MSLEATLNWKHDYLNLPILVSPGKTVYPQARPVEKQIIETWLWGADVNPTAVTTY